MVNFEVKVIIDRPVDIVDAALMKPENFVYWTTDLERFEVVVRTPEGVGSVARLHYLQKGNRYILEDRMIYSEPGKRYVSQVSGDMIQATVETLLQPLGDQVEMTLRWAGKGKRPLIKLLLPVMKRGMIKQSEKELQMFKGLVETRGSDFFTTGKE